MPLPVERQRLERLKTELETGARASSIFLSENFTFRKSNDLFS
jgi:hypothetical protein